MLAALLALAASFTWGTSNYLAGVESRTRSVWHVAALSQIAAAAASAVALVAARQAAARRLGPLPAHRHRRHHGGRTGDVLQGAGDRHDERRGAHHRRARCSSR